MGSNFCGCNNNPSQNPETDQVIYIRNNQLFFTNSFQFIKIRTKFITPIIKIIIIII